MNINELKIRIAETKEGAMWLFMIDCASELNLSTLGWDCFGQSESWVVDKLRGSGVVDGDEILHFTTEECRKILAYIHALAEKLNTAAERIEKSIASADGASGENNETHKHRMEMREMMMPKSKEELFKMIDKHVRVQENLK